MKNFNNKALDLGLTALRDTDQAIMLFTSEKSLPKPLDCRPGCHYCCYNIPMVTPPELLLIGHYVTHTFEEPEINAILDRTDSIRLRTGGLDAQEVIMIRHELPCIFLEHDLCSVYQVRPVICRTCTSTSAEHCKMIFESRNHRARLQCYKHIRDIFQSVHSQLIDGCLKMNLQADVLSLVEGIRDYFRHPNAVDAWLKGDAVFNPLVRSDQQPPIDNQ